MVFRNDEKQRLSYIRRASFPQSFRHPSLSNRVVLGIGGNVGDVVRRFEKLLHYFRRDPFIALVSSSIILKNPAFGYTHQDDFFNSVVIVETTLGPKAFLQHILRVEKRFGRKRSFANAPRTLDIDILFFNAMTMNDKSLTIPHPAWYQRDSVLIPLHYLGV